VSQEVVDTMMTGVPIAQNDSEVLVVTAGHFASGATTLNCLLGERSTVKSTIVATDIPNDLALIVGKLDGRKYQWQLSKLARVDAINGDVVSIGYPLAGSVQTSDGRITGSGWCDIRFVSGESGGPVFQNQRVVGIISAATPSQTMLANPQFQQSVMSQPGIAAELAKFPGPLQDKLRSYYAPLERDRHLGHFVPVSKVREFMIEARQKLATDYPILATNFDREIRP
jgi:hypothetical protein